MLFLLRKVRKSLLKQNKFTSYLLYAIGEIFLVVIGILIAVSLNNWNNEAKERDLEEKILNEILVELKGNKQDLIDDINSNFWLMRIGQNLITHLHEKRPYNDSIRIFMGISRVTTQYTPTTLRYDTLKNIGVGLITNDSVRKDISYLYEVSLSNSVKLGQDYDLIENANQNLVPYLTKHFTVDFEYPTTRGTHRLNP